MSSTPPAGITFGGWARALSAAHDDRVFVIGGDNAAYGNYSAGNEGTWQFLGGYVKALSAGLDDFHNDQVFGIGGDNHIYVHDAGPDPYWYVVDSTASFTQISATQQNTVYAHVPH